MGNLIRGVEFCFFGYISGSEYPNEDLGLTEPEFGLTAARIPFIDPDIGMTRAAQTKMSSSQFWTAQMSRSFQGHDRPDKANKRSWIRAKQRWIPLRIYKLTWSYQWACYQSLASDCSEHITKPAVTWMTWYSHTTSFSWVVELVWVFLGRISEHMFIQDKEIIEASISIIKKQI